MATLKDEMDKLKEHVQLKFEHIREAIGVRERLLLRQIDVIASSTQQVRRASVEGGKSGGTCVEAPPEVQFLTDNEDQLLGAIRSYGKLNFEGMNLALQDQYLRSEDYIAPSDDHETMYKRLPAEQLAAGLDTAEPGDAVGEEDEQLKEAITVDFSRNKSLIEHNVSNMNESIINITVAEAEELVRKAKTKRHLGPFPPLNLEELDDDHVSSVAETACGLEKPRSCNLKPLKIGAARSENNGKKPKKQRSKPNITINSCNGTINLRNVENLTINCSSEEAVSSLAEAESSSASLSPDTPFSAPFANSEASGMSSNSSSNVSSLRSQAQKNKNNNAAKTDAKKLSNEKVSRANAHSSENDNEVRCEFYNRLLNEIKNYQLKQMATHRALESDPKSKSNATSCVHQQASFHGKRLILKNLENLKIVLESNGTNSNGAADESFQSVQIEQWLSDIITETDLEPMQNTDILEHSRLHGKSVSENVGEDS